jgi:hypothetical protein
MAYRKMLEELDAGEYEGRQMMKMSEELHSYISICASIQILDKGSQSPLDILKSLWL